MVSEPTWVRQALVSLKALKIEHRNYKRMKKHLSFSGDSIRPGELLVVVGPTRVGKTVSIRDALSVPEINVPDADGHMRCVFVEAGNDSTSGEFSTKSFMVECLRAIKQPFYGTPAEDDPWDHRLHALLHRTSEATLRFAFEKALERRKTEYLIFDEAHHVDYVRGGNVAAARVLDSWKCLANRTQVKLVLSGSYKLLSLLSLAPHLLGRQQPLEFARYRSDSEGDVEVWEQTLRKFSELLEFEGAESLSTWNRMLFAGSFGCVGALSRWLRGCLALIQAEGHEAITLAHLQASRLPARQEAQILAEIIFGEANLERVKVEPQVDAASADADSNASRLKVKSKRKLKPFQRGSRRSPAKGRS
jgi:hypothetical protein